MNAPTPTIVADPRRALNTALQVAVQDVRDDHHMHEPDLWALQEIGAEIGKLAKATAERINSLSDGRMGSRWKAGLGEVHEPMRFSPVNVAECMVESAGLDCLDGFSVIRAAAVMEAGL